MVTRGITSNKLVSDLFEGITKNVPIGQTPLTNTFADNPESVYPQTVGQPLTYITINEFEVIGEENDTKTLTRQESQNSIEFSQTLAYNNEALVEAAFDEASGALNLVKRDGTLLKITGFLTQSDFGVGAPGSSGAAGRDGADGPDGDDGDEGAGGCAGVEGNAGEQGEDGEDGKDGPVGIPGPIGQTGNPGLRGPVGKKGKEGYEGSRGQKGLSCTEGSAGAAGEAGTATNPSVVISSSAPTDNSLMWGKL